MIPRAGEPQQCARCGAILAKAWRGHVEVFFEVPAGTAGILIDELRRLAKDIEAELCWTCLDEALARFVAWRDDGGSAGAD